MTTIKFEVDARIWFFNIGHKLASFKLEIYSIKKKLVIN